MEHRQNDEADRSSIAATTPPPMVELKRSPRMLHETSFIASSIIPGHSHQFKRPPGFIASSLDYQLGANRGSSPYKEQNRPLTTKPVSTGKTSIKEEQERERVKREREYQKQRDFLNGNPTRARGHYGPPSLSVQSLDDLENLTDDQVYKLLLEDPELHASFMKATDNKKKRLGKKSHSTSAPVGARRARSGDNRNSSSKPSRSPTSKRSPKLGQVEKEVPYFQWLVILVVLGAVLNQIRKSYASPTTTTKNGSAQNVKKNKSGGKPKNRKGSKTTKKNLPKKITESKPKLITPIKQNEPIDVIASASSNVDINGVATTKLHSSLNSKKQSVSHKKKKSKEQKQKQKPLVNNNDSKEHDQPESTEDLQYVEGKKEEKDKSVVIGSVDPMASSLPNLSDPDDGTDDWQTVGKVKGDTRGKTTGEANVNTDDNDSIGNKLNDNNTITNNDNTIKDTKEHFPVETVSSGIVSKEKVDSYPKGNVGRMISLDENKENTVNTSKPSEGNNTEDGNINTLRRATENTKEDSSVGLTMNQGNKLKQVQVSSFKEMSTAKEPQAKIDEKSLENDAAFALRLHEEEMNLARVTTSNNVDHHKQEEEDAWEEVTSKKKK